MPSGVYIRTEKIKEALRKTNRRFPLRTKEWNINISKALSKEKLTLKCICGKEFQIPLYRKLTAKFCSAECQRKYRNFKKGFKSPKGSLAKLGNKNPMWGKVKENPTLVALHQYMYSRVPKSDKCQHCGEKKKLVLANKSHMYKRIITDWLWLCHKCHMRYDGYDKYLELGRYKGKIVSEETKRKLKLFHKGHIPWNKGKKGLQVAWNKGKKNNFTY